MSAQSTITWELDIYVKLKQVYFYFPLYTGVTVSNLGVFAVVTLDA